MREGNFLGELGGGGHACGFLFNFSKVTENAIITIKLLIFSTSLLDHALSMDNVCNHRLFSFPAKVEMAEEQEYL